MRFLIALFIVLRLAAPAIAAPASPAAVEQAILNMQLERAEKMALELPAGKHQAYYQARTLFIRYLAFEDPAVLERFLTVTKKSLQSLEKLSRDDPDRNALLAETLFARGVAKLLDQRIVSAALDLKSACSLVDRNQQHFPDHPNHRKLLGLYHVGMGNVPKKFQWISGAFCFRGDTELGMSHLRAAAGAADYLPEEAEVVLFYIEKNLNGEADRAFARAERLNERHPASGALAYLKLSAMLEQRKIDAALDFCKDVEPGLEAEAGAPILPIWYYAQAKAHYFRLDFESATQYFDRFLKEYRGRTLRSDALFRKGMALALQDRYPEARRVFHEMASLKSSQFDEDEYARHMASIYRFRAPSSTEQALFRARNLFDGGYYGRSLELLETLTLAMLNENEATELHYRRGRNLQALGDLAPAQLAYQKSVDCNPGHSLWMKVYALFYSAQIAEAEDQLRKAKELYEQALTFDGYEYQSGLEQKAKAAIHRLDQKNH